jgi:hypothetical protein
VTQASTASQARKRNPRFYSSASGRESRLGLLSLRQATARMLICCRWGIGLRAERGNDRLSALSRNEQRTMLTMWSIFHFPLMFGGDLITLDPFTTKLLTNRAVLELDQHSTENHMVYSEWNLRARSARSEAKGQKRLTYLALFNLGDLPFIPKYLEIS